MPEYTSSADLSKVLGQAAIRDALYMHGGKPTSAAKPTKEQPLRESLVSILQQKRDMALGLSCPSPPEEATGNTERQ